MIIKTFLILDWLHKVESLKRENFGKLHITQNQYRNLLANNHNQEISYIDLIHKVESLIFENFQILRHAKNRNSDMQESYKRNFLYLTSCTK